jgi:hypothetical protein
VIATCFVCTILGGMKHPVSEGSDKLALHAVWYDSDCMEVWSSAHSKSLEHSKQIGTDIHHNVHVYKMLNLKEWSNACAVNGAAVWSSEVWIP